MSTPARFAQKFADGGRLAGPVDADDQHDSRPMTVAGGNRRRGEDGKDLGLDELAK
jgi:hypothetical protein